MPALRLEPVLRFAQEVATETVAHGIMRPRIDGRLLGQTTQSLGEDVNIPLWHQRASALLVRGEPGNQVVSDVYEAPLPRLCLYSFYLNGSVL